MHPFSIARMHRALAICVVGIAIAGLLSAQVITPRMLELASVYVLLGAVVLAIALGVAKATQWSLASTVALTWLVAFAWMEGWRACVALAGLMVAGLAIGSWFRIGGRNA